MELIEQFVGIFSSVCFSRFQEMVILKDQQLFYW